MGILNVTPDSFSDGGQHFEAGSAIDQAARMVDEGADIIDIGGESTRPGADPVTPQQQLDRVAPVIEAIADRFAVPISIDTSDPFVMQQTVAAGAGLINDIRALTEPGALEAAVKLRVPVCVMHMKGTPQTMQNEPHYNDVVAEVAEFLMQRQQACVEAGIARERIVVDPGFGFGKSTEHNLQLLEQLNRFAQLGSPMLAGLSRKGMISVLLGLPVDERMHASVALAVLAAQRGASIVRVHDVRATHDAIRMIESVEL